MKNVSRSCSENGAVMWWLLSGILTFCSLVQPAFASDSPTQLANEKAVAANAESKIDSTIESVKVDIVTGATIVEPASDGTTEEMQLDTKTKLPPVSPASEEESVELGSVPLLPSDHPEWVGKPDQVEGEIHRLSVATELMPTKEACMEKRDVALVEAAKKYVLAHVYASDSWTKKVDREVLDSHLTAAWIREHWLVPKKEWIAKIDRPVGTYYQLWSQLEIYPDSRVIVLDWLRDTRRYHRGFFVLGSCAAVGGLAASLHFLLGIFPKARKRG